MPDTNYTESNALLALMRGDEAEARDILDEMLPAERQSLHTAARRLRWLASDENRCPGCSRYVEQDDWRSVSSSNLGDGYQRWHGPCWEAK